MINLIKNNRRNYHQKIIDKLGDYAYRMKRYDLDFSVAIGFSEDEVNLAEFISIKRRTDEFIVLEDNLCCIILDGADSNSAIKAASNLQTEFQHRHFNTKLFVSVVTAKDYDNDAVMINSLFDILEYSILNNMDNMVIDNHQIISHKS